MFYPVDSLKRGGRFYLCWVADSWPLRFATITHRQLWSQDIRKICDDMLKVMTAESGRPVNRFSLRLSSQLMRGLVRLYQRKVTIFLSELCMLNAHVFKHTNKKFNIRPEVTEHAPRLVLQVLPAPREELLEENENDQRVAELIQNSGNVVGNIQDITLKESAIPDFQLPPNDGFGEEHPEQAFQLITDRTIETMMHADRSAIQHSGLDVAADTTDLLDKSRLQPQDIQMERLSEHDITLFSNVAATELRPTGDFDKDIPEIPEIPIPEMPVPEADKQPTNKHVEAKRPAPQLVPEQGTSPPAHENTLELVLEELEENEPPAKKRRRNKLIIDKKIKISGDVLHVRIGNPDVELRCQDSSDDIIDIRLPAKEYYRRPCKSGWKFNSKMAGHLTKLYLRNLGPITRTYNDREMEQPVAHRTRRAYVSGLQRIEEEPTGQGKLPVDQPNIEVNISKNVTSADIITTDQSIHQIDISTIDQPQLNVTTTDQSIRQVDISMTDQVLQVEAIDQPMRQIDPLLDQPIPQEIDIADLPTQKLESSQPGKRKSTYNKSPKKRAIGYVSYRQSQEMAIEVAIASEANKENIPDNSQMSEKQQKTLTSMLEKAGLADIAVARILEAKQMTPCEVPEILPAKRSSESETPLGSVDRTRVSLGDSDVTTESIRFIRDQWGTTGTLTKIMKYIEIYRQKPLTVWTLLSKGPVIPDYRNVIAARCFTSILKLKQHGFVIVRKDPETLEIVDIALGPKFDDNIVKNIFIR